MSRLLVCSPEYFQIDYEINPWMRRTNAVVPSRAVSQWQALMHVLERDVGAGLNACRRLRDCRTWCLRRMPAWWSVAAP